MRVSPEELQTLWEVAYQKVSAPNPVSSFRAQLLSDSVSSISNPKLGSPITQTSGNGHSVTFADPTGNFSSAQDWSRAYRHLVNLFDDLKKDIWLADDAVTVINGATATDLQIYAEGLNRLQPVDQFGSDATFLRFG